ncbi:SIMPL domain-containing protein [Tessaracoccus sp. SD287]|uniref:SIMPL domain-containing protein n=1 Tax=Tessaracoccus sp. SD287 TaxID=2782008 RepID=UPI001A970D53|nr:SIMPL domain-containing protein [Tessaracoccus sp. SD287]MBO1031022.1 SIMPL domain-containing protein [Tessaracoccus sp. SD287]
MEITVRAAAQGRRAPQIAVLDVRACHESDDQQQASHAAHQLMKNLSDQLRALQAQRPEIVDRLVVTAVSNRSWRPWNNEGKQLPMRHESSGRVRVALTDVAVVAELTQGWSGVAGLTVEAPGWELTEQSQRDLEAEVTVDAVQRCRQRAEVMARASGFTEVVPLQVADTGLLDHPRDGGVEGAAMAMAAPSTAGGQDAGFDLSPRDIEVRVEVEARFRAQ